MWYCAVEVTLLILVDFSNEQKNNFVALSCDFAPIDPPIITMAGEPIYFPFDYRFEIQLYAIEMQPSSAFKPDHKSQLLFGGICALLTKNSRKKNWFINIRIYEVKSEKAEQKSAIPLFSIVVQIQFGIHLILSKDQTKSSIHATICLS